MTPAAETQTVRPGLYFWQTYDPAVKIDLSCCAFGTPAGLIFCDPVPLAPAALEELTARHTPAAILLTSANHERHAVRLAQQLGVDIWAHTAARGQVAATRWFENGVTPCGAQAIELPGFAEGETAFWVNGLLIIGDALIHIAPYGFTMLPDKYCEDPRAARAALARLLPLPVETITFAHGLPIVARASQRLRALVTGEG